MWRTGQQWLRLLSCLMATPSLFNYLLNQHFLCTAPYQTDHPLLAIQELQSSTTWTAKLSRCQQRRHQSLSCILDSPKNFCIICKFVVLNSRAIVKSDFIFWMVCIWRNFNFQTYLSMQRQKRALWCYDRIPNFKFLSMKWFRYYNVYLIHLFIELAHCTSVAHFLSLNSCTIA